MKNPCTCSSDPWGKVCFSGLLMPAVAFIAVNAQDPSHSHDNTLAGVRRVPYEAVPSRHRRLRPYETVAGYVVRCQGRVDDLSDIVHVHGFDLVVGAAQGRRLAGWRWARSGCESVLRRQTS